jgi:hypothetical protein
MPQVVIAAITIFGNAVVALGAIGNAMGFGIGVGALAAGAAVVIGGVMVAKRVMSLFEVELPVVDTDASRQRTVKSTTEPQKIIYGEALVSGPISFIGLSGTDNSDLYQTIVLAGHEVTEITDIHMDDVVISNADINGGSAAGGAVGSGSVEFGPKNGTICVINKYKGETSQTADPLFTAAFSTGPASNRYTSAHRGDGIAYLAMKWVLNEDSAETWEKFSPSNVKALVKGKPVYDPRLDTGAPNYNPLDQLFITYNATAGSYVGQGQNPALVLADYLISDLGMGISPSKIDWSSFITAANGCDVSVSVPGGTEKRFTCNGVIFATDSHQKNINKILSSMNGNLVYSNGKYIVHAGIFEDETPENPFETLNEDDLIGAISIRTSLERADRFNTIKGLFIDPAQNHKSTEFPKVQLTDAVTRDNNEILEKEVQYPMTNSSYMAQRLSHKLIQLSDQQKVVTFPANLSALRITAGDRVKVSIEELSWSNKVFQCAGWTFSEDGGVNLTLREDSSTSYSDPAVNEYSTVTATGSITDAFRGVPSPSGLSATAGLKSNELNWVNPAKPNDFGTIYVYASRNANFSSAIKIGETDGTQFIHDASNKSLIFFPSVVNVGDTYTIRTLGNTDFVAMGAASNTVGVVFTATSTGSGTGNLWETIAPGNLRYYWVRAVRNVGTDAASQSNLEPNADPNTTVFATVGRVNWADVAGSTNAPEDNATVGAQLSVNLYDANGTTVLSDVDVKNSILAQEILEVEIEAGEVLNLETGQDVDIQNLGDVAIYVSDSNQTLNTSINTVANNLSALETVVVDLTSGVSEVFVQATAPVAGVNGIPNPIPDFSRWYDSSSNNQPYYWDGSAWQDLRDGQTTQNAAAITNLQTSLTTTNSNVTTNASAITVLDATSVTQGNSITSITSDVTALETTVDDPSTGVAATSTALGNLTTRVTTAEGSITTNASDITTLQTDVTTAEGNITTNAGAISGLDTRVTTAEGSIVSQASDITALETTVNNGTTGVAANASGLSALTTRVTDNEDGVLVNAGAVTTLNATYTEDLHFRTQAEDENDDLIDLETSGTVELQDLTDFVSGSSAAIDSLTVQTFANENGIQTQAIQLTALESTVNDPTNGVVATAGALSSLSTTVSVIDGQVTSTAQDLTTLTTTVGDNTSSITTQATSIDGVEANYSVKIDNNNRITGFGLLSTTSGATPFSEFAVVADQFSIVSPDSTADTPIQPFTVTADKIYFGADVIVSGDLISTGTISADRLQIDGVMFDTETVGGVTSLIIKESGINTSQIAESAITTARLSNDAVTVDKFANTLQSTNYVADTSGWQILTSGDVEFQNAKITGEITATSGSISNTVTVGGTAASTVASGAAAGATANQDSTATILGGNLTGQVDGAAVATIKSGAASGATAIQDNDTGLTLGLQAGSAGPVTISYTAASGGDPEVAKLYQGTGTFNNSNTGFYLDNSGNFSLQDKLAFNGSTLAVDGEITSVSGTIGGFTLGSTSLTAGDGTTRVSLSTVDGIHLGDNTFASAPFRVTPAGAVTATSVNITGTVDASDGFTFDGLAVSGTLAAGNIDVSGVITSGSLITNSATIANDIRIGSGEAVFSADSNGIYLGNETFANAEFRVSPAGALTASSATLTGNVTASSFTLAQGATLSDLDGAIANTQQLMAQVTGIIDANQHAIPSFWRITTDDALAPSNTEFNAVAGRLPKINDIVITTDTTTTPDTTYGWTCSVAGVADPATEATWVAITNFISGDLLVDGSVSADQINANSVASAIITAGSIVVENDLSDGTTIISGSNILTGEIIADYIDVSGVIQAGALITDTATINNDIRIGSGQSVFSADSNGIYLGNETFADAEFRVTPAGVLTATGANVSGTITVGSTELTEANTLNTNATASDVGLANVENLDAQNQAQTGLIAGTTITNGGITMSSGGAIKTTGKDSESNTTNGFFLGYNGSNYTFGVGDANQSMQWTGSALNIVGALNATSLNVTSITGAVTGFDAGKISGEVTESYPIQIYENPGISVPLSLTTMAEFSIPATEANVVKRNYIQGNVTYVATITPSGTSDITLWSTRILRKSKGNAGALVGTVVAASAQVLTIQTIEISGNITGLMDSSGAVDSTSNGSSTNGPASVFAVWYQSDTNRTYLKVSSTNAVFSVSDSVYHSPDNFTSAGTWVGAGFSTLASPYLTNDNSVSYTTLPIIYGLGPTTTATDIRIVAQRNTSAPNLTISFQRFTGIVGSYA